MVDARLPDGSRVNAVIHPLAIGGPFLTIRKFAVDPYTETDLIKFGTYNQRVADFLRACVRGRLNIIISGGTGSGKTTTLNVLSSYLPDDERIVTIEDAAELQLHQEHVLSLEARPSNIEGKGQVTIRDLVRNCLRMRPDRIVVGECRGGEALDMLQAMNTGHDGSLTTIHANAPRDTLSRIETMVLMAGFDLPVKAIREQVASAVHLIVQLQRLKDGTRRVTHITEVEGMEGEIITLQDLFLFDYGMGVDESGRYLGRLKPTGIRPSFSDKLADQGIRLPGDLFDPEPFSKRQDQFALTR
jgi:pilus assembly protein CpaF